MKRSRFILLFMATFGLCSSCYWSGNRTFDEDVQDFIPDGAPEISSEVFDVVADREVSPVDAPDDGPAEQDIPIESPPDAAEVHDGDMDEEDETSRMATCDEVMSESHYCVTIVENDIPLVGLVGLETGNLCLVSAAVIQVFPSPGISMGWIDPYVFICGSTLEALESSGIIRISTMDGSIESITRPCWAVTTYNEGILVRPDLGSSALQYFHSFEDAMAGDYEEIHIGHIMASVITVQGQRLYAPFHSGSDVPVFLLPSGESLDPVHLEGFDDGFNGFSVTEDGLAVVYTGFSEYQVAVFDLATGRALWSVYPPSYRSGRHISGLYCMPGL